MAATITLTSALSVLVLITASAAVPSLGDPCYEIDFDAISVIANGTTWTRRCHTCACIDGVIACDGPSCANKYKPEFEYMCTKWSPDNCCCDHVGCMVDGVPIDMNAWYKTSADPCLECQCGLGQRSCRSDENCVATIPSAGLD
ncbi:kielin/chordin-like protein [Haliotis rufescens]|uniref:kielin/chordin-like protein n=1 Tax=Haliotis rufescens TaxID=6454 RepID=UPI00201EEE2F|nr:kielin/chordin-like protein [Haliotis rufescens]